MQIAGWPIDVWLLMLVLVTAKVMIIRLGVKFIEMMFSLKNYYDSLQHHRPAHVMTIMTEATELFGLTLLSKDPQGKPPPHFIFLDTAGIMRLLF